MSHNGIFIVHNMRITNKNITFVFNPLNASPGAPFTNMV